MYNISYIANSTGILQFVQRVNSELVSGLLGVLWLGVIATIIFMSFILKTNNPRQSFAATAYITFTLCLLLRAINLVPNLTIFITLSFLGVATFLLILKD